MFLKYKKLLLWKGYHILMYLYSLLNHFSVGKILQNISPLLQFLFHNRHIGYAHIPTLSYKTQCRTAGE